MGEIYMKNYEHMIIYHWFIAFYGETLEFNKQEYGRDLSSKSV